MGAAEVSELLTRGANDLTGNMTFLGIHLRNPTNIYMRK